MSTKLIIDVQLHSSTNFTWLTVNFFGFILKVIWIQWWIRFVMLYVVKNSNSVSQIQKEVAHWLDIINCIALDLNRSHYIDARRQIDWYNQRKTIEYRFLGVIFSGKIFTPRVELKGMWRKDEATQIIQKHLKLLFLSINVIFDSKKK